MNVGFSLIFDIRHSKFECRDIEFDIRKFDIGFECWISSLIFDIRHSKFECRDIEFDIRYPTFESNVGYEFDIRYSTFDFNVGYRV